MKNFGLNSNDEVHQIIKRPPEVKSVKALPDKLQKVWTDLNRAFHEPVCENEYKLTLYCYRLACKKVNWVRKTKLSSY